MLRTWILGLTVGVFCAGGAPLLSVVPSNQVVQAGSVFQVDLLLSGLVANQPPSVGAYGAEVEFDPLRLSFVNATFGLFLGLPGVDSLIDVTPLFSGVNVAQVSLLPGGTLDSNHPAAYSLVSLTFMALDAGSSPLALSNVTLDDPAGLKLEFTTADGSVQVVPEPSAWMLLALGGALQMARLIRSGKSVK